MQIVLLGVCVNPGPGGEAAEELTLQPLPLYACSSDNVTMCSVATTPDGRIFTGGANGLLYEIVYNSTDTWRKKRCYKVGPLIFAGLAIGLQGSSSSGREFLDRLSRL